jgi:hypothetical protein
MAEVIEALQLTQVSAALLRVVLPPRLYGLI